MICPDAAISDDYHAPVSLLDMEAFGVGGEGYFDTLLDIRYKINVLNFWWWGRASYNICLECPHNNIVSWLVGANSLVKVKKDDKVQTYKTKHE